MSEVSFPEPEQILPSGTEPELEPPAVHPAPPGADWVSSSSSEDDETKYIRLLETVSHPSELSHHAREALQALAQLMEEEDLAREITAGPVVRDNIPNLDQPIFVHAYKTDPKIMTPTAMLKATAANPTPPNIPRPLPQPLDTPELQHEFETIIETSLQPENEPPPPSTPRVELPEGLQDDLEQIMEENTLYKQSPAETSQ